MLWSRELAFHKMEDHKVNVVDQASKVHTIKSKWAPRCWCHLLQTNYSRHQTVVVVAHSKEVLGSVERVDAGRQASLALPWMVSADSFSWAAATMLWQICPNSRVLSHFHGFADSYHNQTCGYKLSKAVAAWGWFLPLCSSFIRIIVLLQCSLQQFHTYHNAITMFSADTRPCSLAGRLYVYKNTNYDHSPAFVSQQLIICAPYLVFWTTALYWGFLLAVRSDPR